MQQFKDRLIDCARGMLTGETSQEDERTVANWIIGKRGDRVPDVISDAADRVFNRNGSDMDRAAVAAYVLGDSPHVDCD